MAIQLFSHFHLLEPLTPRCKTVGFHGTQFEKQGTGRFERTCLSQKVYTLKSCILPIYSQLKAILKVTNNDLLRAQLALEVSNARIGMSSHVI